LAFLLFFSQKNMGIAKNPHVILGEKRPSGEFEKIKEY
jgi:hypothetical protein